MSTAINTLSHKMQRMAAGTMIDMALSHAAKDREKAYMQMIDLAEQLWGDGFPPESYDKAREMVRDPNNKWVRFVNRVLDETDPHVAKMTALNLGYEAFIRGTKRIRRNRELYQCNVPWLILFDPTSACNMHCEGCWAGTYGNHNNLSFDDMDRIVTEGKALGVYLYMMTGGEPLVRKADILRLAEKHNDAEFGIYTNSSLIDEALCEKVAKLGNIVIMLSIEGTPERNDARRGEGHYAGVMRAMDLLKEHGILFGTSICYTRANIEAVTNDAFMQMLADKGARFGFYFHYMPVGNNAVPELMPTVEQREYMIERIRYMRSSEWPVEFYPMDFQNDGQYVGGCIAGGRNYFHINSAGDAEPCVFIHYSNANIHDSSILDILRSPLFMAYRDGQPFNKNHLRPCPMLENPELLEEMVHKTGAHSTDLESPESVEHLCAKCKQYAESWQPAADEVWSRVGKPCHGYQNYKGWQPEAKPAVTDKAGNE